jgi:hypothetical protein
MYNEEIERLINVALADCKITESERRALEKKAENYGIDLVEFNHELDSRLLNILIDDALAEGNLTDKKRRKLENQAKLLGLDLDVFNLELDARFQEVNTAKNKNATDAVADAKAYITAFRETIKTTAVYSPTGKYGKNVLDTQKTKQKKDELISMEKPSTPERLNEFLLFLLEIKNTKKISSLLNTTDKCTLESLVLNKTISKCKKAIRREKLKYVFAIVLACLCSIGCIVVHVFLWRSDMHLIWKILISVFSAPAALGLIAILWDRIPDR